MSRPRGFAPWKPRQKALELIEAVRTIIRDYDDQLPLTLRQCFYIAVTRGIIGKTEVDYSRLLDTMVSARRAQMMPMDVFRDDGFTQGEAAGWQSADNFIYNVSRWVDEFTLDRQAGQDKRLIVWCEAQGMVPQLQRVADDYSVPVYSSGGFDSLTTKHSTAKQIADSDKLVHILHIGDHDPSGVHMHNALDEDLQAFVSHYHGNVETVRLAVTPEQVESYQLPTAPPKKTDRRQFSGNLTTQCEALDPQNLAAIVRQAIESRQAVINRERDEQVTIRRRFALL